MMKTGRMILTTAASLACLAGVQAAASSAVASGAELLVNDADALGAVGDERLSLSEAIALANGSLSVGTLSAAERRQVKGTPGSASADTIRFRVTGGTIRFPLQVQKKPDMDFAVLVTSSKLPDLSGNDGDRIVGGGIRFANGPDDAADTVNEVPLFKGAPLGGTGLVIESSNFSLSGVTFDRFIQPLVFRPAAGSAGLVNVTLKGNRFVNSGGVSFSAMAGGERSALRNILVEKNEFLGSALYGETYPSKLHNAIAVTGASGAAPKDGQAETVIVDDIRIIGNKVREYAGGVQVQPLQVLFGKNRGAELTRLVVARNDISLGADAGDPAVYLWGAVAVNGEVSDVRVEDVLVERNRIVGNGHVLFLSGVEALLGGTAPATNIHFSNIRINANRILPRTNCSFGITAIAAFPEMNGPAAVGNSLSDVSITGNIVDRCAIGIFASPLLNVGAPGTSTGNRIDRLTLRANRVSGARNGIIVAGGAVIADEVKGDIGVEKNLVRGLEIMDNILTADEMPILVAGAYARGKVSASLTDNSVDVVRLRGNRTGRAAAPCRIEGNFAEETSILPAGNQVTGATESCSVSRSGTR